MATARIQRERSWLGRVDGQPLLVTSTGIGGLSASETANG